MWRGVLDEPLEEHGAVAERGGGLAAGSDHGFDDVGGRTDDTHAASAAAERGLDQQRVADLVGHGGDGGSVDLLGVVDGGAGQDGDARLLHQLLRGDLGTHRLDGLDGRADEDDPGLGTGAGEFGVLGQEPVAGVDRVGASRLRRGDDQVRAQVGLRRGGAGKQHRLVGGVDEQGVGIRVGMDGDGGDVQCAGGADDPLGDLPAVGDEQFVDGHRVPHIRKTP
jgi:hypothetical protein